jgi:hypothetical protein
MTRKILFTGSRDASPEMLAMVDMYIRGNLYDRDVSVIVGDADGVGYQVIQTCDECDIPIEVHGGYGKMLHKTWTGKNIVHDTDYPGRDKIIVSLLGQGDRCIAVWNGKWGRGRSGTVLTARFAEKAGIETEWIWMRP